MKISPFSPIHREGWRFVPIFAVVTIILFYIFQPLGWIGFILTAWCAYFFRNPKRVTPQRKGLMISPADGIVQSICKDKPPKELELKGDKWTRVSIFMDVFNVHVNRIPIDGTIKKINYRPGKFLNATLDKASEYNERQSFVLEMENKQLLPFVQIAGLIARRIRCDVKVDETVKTGQYFGLIRFGSRVDVYLPEGVAPLVIEGQTTVAGETVIADLESKESQRKGTRH